MSVGALTLMATPSASVPASSFPYGLAVDPQSKYLYAVLAATPYGVAQFSIDQGTGQLSPIGTGTVAGISAGNARWPKVTPDGKFLVVAARGRSEVWSYSINQTDGSLTGIGKAPGALASSPDGVAISPNSKFAIVPMYGNSTVVVYPLDTIGNLGTGTSYACGSAPQGVTITPPDASGICGVYIASTGNTRVMCFSFDQVSGVLTPTSTPFVASPSNFPNALVSTNDGLFVYVACDSANYLTGVYSRDPSTNNLTALASPAQTTDNNGGPWNIDVSKDASNTTLYVAQSDAQLVTQYDRNVSTGLLTAKTPGSVNTRSPSGARVGSGGPYGFVVAPNNKWAYSSEQSNSSIAQFNVEQAAGPTVTSVTVSPSSATVSGSTTRQFSATVNGTNSPSQSVTWSVTGAGSINASTGLYTAPAATGSAQSATITATSVADGTKAGTATVSIPAAVATSLSITLVNTSNVPWASLTGVSWALFDQTGTASLGAPSVKGSAGTTNASGVMTLNITGTTLAPGANGTLLVTHGTKAFCGVVGVS
jgi:6-phosphogluconolactonase (cycloisomerase 2 family)